MFLYQKCAVRLEKREKDIAREQKEFGKGKNIVIS